MLSNSSQNTQKITSHLGGKMSIYSASGDLTEEQRIREPIEKGLKLVISNVDMDLRTNGVESFQFREPVAFAILNDKEIERDQTFRAGQERWDIKINLSHQLVMDEFGKEPEELLGHSSQSKMTLKAISADAAIRSVGLKLLTIPDVKENLMARLGTGLSLASLVLNQLSGANDTPQPTIKLTDKERVSDVVKLMKSDLSNVPTVQDLAKKVGTNSNKLTRDFVSVKGVTPHAWLQEERMKEAWRLLSDHSVTVSQAAYATGYTPAHFSNAFRKRFNVTPRSIQNG